MNILSRSDQTVTEGWRALNLFTDRHETIRLFSEYLNESNRQNQILFFGGDGGNGKSLLLNLLRKYYCKVLTPENWTYLKSKPDEEFVSELRETEGARAVPSTLLDFGMQPRGDDRPQENFSALLMLYRMLSQQGFRFPLYVYASLWYLHKTGRKIDQDQLRNLFPSEEMGFLSTVADAISKTATGALVNAALSLFMKHLREHLTMYLQRRAISEESLAQIQLMEAESELIDHLPHFFAQDLNAFMSLEGAPAGVVLFFDTHEAFWGDQKNLPEYIYFQRDEWLRRLLGNLDLSLGIVAVVAGRELPRWSEAPKVKIPGSAIDSHLVGYLSTADAECYLIRAGVECPDLRRSLVSFSAVQMDEVHPLYLGLCADVVLTAKENKTELKAEEFRNIPQLADKTKELVSRLLRYVNLETAYAVRALSACRAFDRDLYMKLGQALSFQVSQSGFDALLRFSFVWRAQRRGEGWYRIHDLLRRLFDESNQSETRQADKILEDHYYERVAAGETEFIAEAIYHANRQDWERGVGEWRTVFEDALQLGRLNVSRALLEVRSELSVRDPYDLGGLSHLEGTYFARISRYDEATQDYLDSLAAYDQALQLQPERIEILNDRAVPLISLGSLQQSNAHYEEAVASYQAGIAAFDQALLRDPGFAKALANKGAALLHLGELQTSLAAYDQALESFGTATATFDEALKRDPDNGATHSNRGLAFLRKGELQSELAQIDAAKASLAESIASFNKATKHVPPQTFDFVTYWNNRALAHRTLGELMVQTSDYDSAEAVYQITIDETDHVLRVAPGNLAAMNNRGVAQMRLAELHALRSQHDKAAAGYELSLKSFHEALVLAPDYVDGYLNRSNVLRDLGDLQLTQLHVHEALNSYHQAVQAGDDALLRAPNHVSAYVNKGTALFRLGGAHAWVKQNAEALTHYGHAITTCDEALRRAPDSVGALNIKGVALLQRADLQKEMGRYRDAVPDYQDAATTLLTVIKIAPGDFAAVSNIGILLRSRADLHVKLKHYEEAIKDLELAVALYNDALAESSENIVFHNGKGEALATLGGLELALSRKDEAIKSLEAAIAEFAFSLESAPDDIRIRKMSEMLASVLQQMR